MSVVKCLMQTCSGTKDLTGQRFRPDSGRCVSLPIFELGATWALRGGKRRGVAAGQIAPPS